MQIQTRHLRHGGTLAHTLADDACIFIVYGEGGGCTLNVSGESSGVWIPLRGAIQVHGANPIHAVRAREILVTERDPRIRAIGHGNCRWLAALGGRRAWKALLANTVAADVQLLPEKYQVDRGLLRKTVALARSGADSGSASAVHVLADAVAHLQSPLQVAIARCPGRTYAKKRQAFLRLQRVRNFISGCCDQEIDNDVLARMANYSPTHFIRIFNEVFLETPHSYLVRQRLQRAERLLRSGTLAVGEVALASGFEDRSAFSRTFRHHFGVTANEVRRQSTANSAIDLHRRHAIA